MSSFIRSVSARYNSFHVLHQQSDPFNEYERHISGEWRHVVDEMVIPTWRLITPIRPVIYAFIVCSSSWGLANRNFLLLYAIGHAV